MAKKQTHPTAPEVIRVSYDLLNLPTAQHKAGLAGLVLQVECMKLPQRRLPPTSIPQLTVEPTTVDAVFTEESLRGLFDDLYDAKTVEARSGTKWKDEPPKREERASNDEIQDDEQPVEAGGEGEPRKGSRAKPKRWFIYDVVEPQGHFLRQFTDDGKEIWHKLWRNMLWSVPRSKPTTRGPFNARADNRSSGEGEQAWRELVKQEKAKRGSERCTTEVAGAVLLGAQALSAESVPFRDVADHALLLHFWQLTVRVFVPERLDADGTREFAGFVLAIPEVANLLRFTDRYKRSLMQLDPTPAGYRPRAALIAVPAQGALEFMDNLATLAGEKTSVGITDVARTLSSVEFFHMVKSGNNVKTMSHGRVVATPDLLMAYEGIKRTCRNPLFLRARLLALLRARPWHAEFGDLLAMQPWPWFISCRNTPRQVASFAWDAASRFRAIADEEDRRRDSKAIEEEAGGMSDTQTSTGPATRSLVTLVHELVRTYVRIKTEQKCIPYESFRNRKIRGDSGRERTDYPKAYVEAREKVCSDLFLGFRSRRESEFVSYFTGTVGSVPQGVAIGDPDSFRVITSALLDPEGWQDVKTLAMLATSAASYAARPREHEDQEDEKETDQ